MDTDMLLNLARTEIADLIDQQFATAKDAAKKDSEAVLQQSKERLEKWTGMLESGTLNEDEFRWLMDSQKDVVTMTALNQVGFTPEKARALAHSTINILAKVAIAALV